MDDQDQGTQTEKVEVAETVEMGVQMGDAPPAPPFTVEAGVGEGEAIVAEPVPEEKRLVETAEMEVQVEMEQPVDVEQQEQMKKLAELVSRTEAATQAGLGVEVKEPKIVSVSTRDEVDILDIMPDAAVL